MSEQDSTQAAQPVAIMKRFCPRCGSEKGPFIKGFCKECYLKEHRLVELPETLTIDHCKRCSKVRLHGKWIEQTEAALKSFIESKLRTKGAEQPKADVSIEPKGASVALAKVAVNLIAEKVPLTIKKEALLKFASGICDSCMKLSSRYHEAVLQLRYGEKPSHSEFRRVFSIAQKSLSAMRATDALAGIVEVQEKPKGFDFLIGSKRAASHLAREFAHGGEIMRSFKVTGVDASGKQKKRYTFCARIKAKEQQVV